MPVLTGNSFWTVTLFKKAKHVGWRSFPFGFSLSAFFFPRNSVVENWTENPSCSLDSRFSSGSCFVPHLSPSEHGPFVVHCMQPPTFMFPLLLDLPSTAAAPEAFQVVFHEKRSSRFFCSRYQTTIFFQSGKVPRFTLLNRILNLQREQWL